VPGGFGVNGIDPVLNDEGTCKLVIVNAVDELGTREADMPLWK
jgi:hypothetical protein